MSNSNNSISPFDPNVPLTIGVDINMNNNKIVNIGDPVNPKDAVNKNYVDAAVASGDSGGVNWFDISQYCDGSTIYLSNNNNIPITNPDYFGYQNNGSSPISITFFVKVGSTLRDIVTTFTFAANSQRSQIIRPVPILRYFGHVVNDYSWWIFCWC